MLQQRIIHAMDAVPAAQWNALTGTHIPFLRHEFLCALERHHCVGAALGWQPRHLLLFEGEQVVGAAPQYLKTNSYGELVFDWAWAEAYARSGLAYYPKLVVAIPYTPASGPRLLVHPRADHKQVADALIEHAIAHADSLRVSSLHWLFPQQQDLEHLTGHGLLPRLGCQFHWHNQNYRDFDDFLSRFTSAKRKKIRQERRAVTEAGVVMRRLYGEELSEAQWQAVHRHYRSTFDRRGGHATLTLAFFLEMSRLLPRQLIVMLAEHQGQPVASAICWRDADTLYGRHWGCDEHFHNLHFEACYYQGLEYCIEHRLQRFDPGAQGEHKISRGFLPTPTWSAHWIADARFRQAIEDFLRRETVAMRAYMQELDGHSPFKQADLV
jgi:predicted N-acyltransferase